MADVAQAQKLVPQPTSVAPTVARATPRATSNSALTLQRRYGNRNVSAALGSEQPASLLSAPSSSSEAALPSSQPVLYSSAQPLASFEPPVNEAVSREPAPLLSTSVPAVSTPGADVAPSAVESSTAPPVASPAPAPEGPAADEPEPAWVKAAFALIEKTGPLGVEFVATLRKGRGVVQRVLADPKQFVVNLATAAMDGFQRFSDHAFDNVKEALFEWLLGAVGSQIHLPEKWDVAGVFKLVAEVLGLTYDNLKRHLVEASSPELVQKIESGVEKLVMLGQIVAKVIKGDWLALRAEIEQHADEVKQKALEAIRGQLLVALVKNGITMLVASLNPAGLLAKGLMAIVDAYGFFKDKFESIVKFAAGILESVDRIARGELGPAAEFVENSIKRALPLMLDFVARLLRIDLAGIIKKALAAIRAPVDRLLAKLAKVLVEQAKKLINAIAGKAKQVAGQLKEWWTAREPVDLGDGGSHHLEFRGSGAGATLVVASSPEEYGAFLGRTAKAVNALTGAAKQQGKAALDEARATWKRIADAKKKLKKSDTTAAIAADLSHLADQTKKIAKLLAPSGEKPPSDVKYGEVTSVGGALRAIATILSSNHPAGSTPQEGAKIWQQVRRRNIKGLSVWIQGHLMNHNLGGAGRFNNLTPLTGTGSTHFKPAGELNANKRHLDQVEARIKAEVDKGAVFYYAIDAKYGKHPTREGTKAVRRAIGKTTSPTALKELQSELALREFEEENVAKALDINAYPLIAADGTWKKDPKGKPIKTSIPNPLPDDFGQSEKLPNEDVSNETLASIDSLIKK